MSAEIVARSTPLPERLPLSFTSHSRSDLTFHARHNAIFYGCAAMLPAFLVGGVLDNVSEPDIWGMVVGAAIVPAAVLYSLWRDCFKPASFWEKTEWLDFGARTWNARREIINRDLAPSCRTLAFDGLALVYFSRMWEQGPSYEVALCALDSWNRPGINSPNCLNILHSADTEAEALDCLFALTSLWGIEGWRWTEGWPATLERVHRPAVR